VFVHFGMTHGKAANGSPVKNYRGGDKACRLTGILRIPHDFRRTAVRNLERAGASRSAAMAMTGHKTEAVYRRYAIVDSGMLREAARKLAAFHAAEQTQQGAGENCQSRVKVEAFSAENQ